MVDYLTQGHTTKWYFGSFATREKYNRMHCWFFLEYTFGEMKSAARWSINLNVAKRIIGGNRLRPLTSQVSAKIWATYSPTSLLFRHYLHNKIPPRASFSPQLYSVHYN